MRQSGGPLTASLPEVDCIGVQGFIGRKPLGGGGFGSSSPGPDAAGSASMTRRTPRRRTRSPGSSCPPHPPSARTPLWRAAPCPQLRLKPTAAALFLDLLQPAWARTKPLPGAAPQTLRLSLLGLRSACTGERECRIHYNRHLYYGEQSGKHTEACVLFFSWASPDSLEADVLGGFRVLGEGSAAAAIARTDGREGGCAVRHLSVRAFAALGAREGHAHGQGPDAARMGDSPTDSQQIPCTQGSTCASHPRAPPCRITLAAGSFLYFFFFFFNKIPRQAVASVRGPSLGRQGRGAA